MTTNSEGLAGVTAGKTKISTVGKAGIGLTYYGYDIKELALKGSFEEVVCLLLNGELPKSEILDAFKSKIANASKLPESLCKVLEGIPKETHPMDVLRTGVSYLGCIEPEKDNIDNVVVRIIATLPSMISYWYRFAHYGERINTVFSGSSMAEHFLRMLQQNTPSELSVRVFDASLTLYAEHEFNASTFTARVCAATLSDIFSCITGAIGTLRGPLHGGANEQAMALMDMFDSPESAVIGVKARLEKKEKIMGFGHRVYKDSDPRSDIIKQLACDVSSKQNEMDFYNKFEAVENLLKDKKGLFPNLDFYAAALYRLLGIPTELFTPIFVIARSSGWIAHVIEQRENNRLIRPSAEYEGPELRSYVGIEDR
ncbi:MAG: 2-methylcitrate synthase [Legionellales bacterium]|nr:2-methylcitrate synthase [Legionellales bacterium]|tara:strand:- start:255 stop:1364 length:1110 start_codon:yes stop_codon:yes gene_type:complete